jgi:hypothetical protein
MIVLKWSALFFSLLLIAGCATPVGYSNQPFETYDKDTEYRADETPTGFILSVYYSRFQFFPESEAVAISCRQALTSLAYELAEKRGRKIVAVNEQRIKMSFGRNGLTGITSCSAAAPVEWAAN